MRLGVGLSIGMLALVGFGAACGQAVAQDATPGLHPSFRLPQQPDFSNAAAELRQADASRRSRPRIDPDAATARADRIALAGGTVEARLRGMGIRNGSSFGERGRLYLFAADGQTAVGYNLTHGDDGWSRQGLSMDDGAFMGDAQAGIAWRQGSLQTSFGYVQRDMPRENRLGRSLDEGIVALHLSFIPRR